MIRFIFDKLGKGHSDLFIKIDNFPQKLFIADSYYLYDFLQVDFKNLKEESQPQETVIEFINFWIERVQNTENGQQIFLPFDLSDQYIGGLVLEKTKKAFKIKKVFTEEIHGYQVSKSNLDQLIIDRKVNFKTEESDWLIDELQISAGLNWSINELKN
ncbi:MAG: hypothetical protein V4642_06615 [Bacteroidota bacterium]